MTNRAWTLLLFAPLAALGAACDEDACRPDGTCLREGYICDYDDVCKRSCASDVACGPGSFCVMELGLCRAGERPDVDAPDSGAPADAGAADSGRSEDGGVDAGPVDSGVPPCRGEVGSGGCACYGNGSCDFGFECSATLQVCVPAEGQENQPCYGNLSCDMGLVCVGRPPLPQVCRPTGVGDIGEACFDLSLNPNAQPCLSSTAGCEEGVCRGGRGDPCATSADCLSGFGCSGGQCRPGAGLCQVRSDCETGQFCCGEPGTPYASPAACPAGARAGACFDAPASTYAVSCQGHADCAPAPTGSPEVNGTSLCMPWEGFVCSAPCDGSAADPGCPRGWSCAPSYLGCFEDADCGAPGLECVGASPSIGRLGRCRCGTAGRPLRTCTSTQPGPGLPTSTCQMDASGAEAFCVVDEHCVPPGG
jgi:hypothetical protein